MGAHFRVGHMASIAGIAPDLIVTAQPEAHEPEALRALLARTAKAHGKAAED